MDKSSVNYSVYIIGDRRPGRKLEKKQLKIEAQSDIGFEATKSCQFRLIFLEEMFLFFFSFFTKD